MVIVGQVAIIVLFLWLLVRAFLQRGLPRVGGKLGPLRTLESGTPVLDGFSRVYARVMTVYAATADATSFASLKSFQSHNGQCCYLAFETNFATSRANSMKTCTTGLTVRSFNVTIPTGHGSMAASTARILSPSRVAQ